MAVTSDTWLCDVINRIISPRPGQSLSRVSNSAPELGVAAHTINLSIKEAEAGGSR